MDAKVILYLLRRLYLAPLVVSAGASVSAQSYLTVDLGAGTYAQGVNSTGQVVGLATSGSLNYAFLYSGGTLTNLGTLPGGSSSDAYSINNSGKIAGCSQIANGFSHAFLYNGGIMTDLGTLSGGSSSCAYGINTAGQVVGYSSTGSGQPHAFLYSGGIMADLGTLGGSQSYALGINDSGQVTGYSTIANGQTHAFLYSGGNMTDLGTLVGGTTSRASAINNSGQIVGYSNYTFGQNDAFLYSGGSMTDLGTLQGGSASQAYSINNSGQIVGYSFNGTVENAFVYSSGTMSNLNSIVTLLGGAYLSAATGINDHGQIAAVGSNGHAYLLTPEPANPLQFYPTALCRLVDTRTGQGKTGAFGPPALAAYSNRDFPLLSGGCAIPSTAQAYSLNFTAVPSGPLSFLSAWPTGEAYPGVSTLNSSDGTTIANAAIVGAGTNGSVTVAAGNATDLVIDINGYFAPAGASGLDFFPVTPCRVADTRAGQGHAGLLGPPSLASYATRDFPIALSPCLAGSSAQAYSLNMTAVPSGPLSFLSAWPVGLAYPGVSTLNSPDGITLANAAIIPAGAGGDIDVVAGNPTDLIIDINGVFAPPQAAGLHFYLVTPCRVADTRAGQSFAGGLGPPSLVAYANRNFSIPSSACGIPASARAYALNITAVPQGPLSFLSAWPWGQAYPGVSTLNSPSGNVIANAAIVAAGQSGINVLAGNPTDVIIDVVGYFAP